jgi:hypothetical protein
MKTSQRVRFATCVYVCKKEYVRNMTLSYVVLPYVCACVYVIGCNITVIRISGRVQFAACVCVFVCL